MRAAIRRAHVVVFVVSSVAGAALVLTGLRTSNTEGAAFVGILVALYGGGALLAFSLLVGIVGLCLWAAEVIEPER